MLDKELVRKIAKDRGWTEVKSTDPTMIAFTRHLPANQKERINVWYTRGTVGTYINHPKQGKTQLFRRYVNLGLLARLFNYPRQHTGRGYHQRVIH